MTTKPSHKIGPMSCAHVRWALRDILRDPAGPLRGVKMPEKLSAGKPDAQAVVDLLSSCGIRRGAKEFFARVLENADEDADFVDRHIGGYGKGVNLAAKSLIRIIVVNSREERPDMEMEAALFACINAAEKMREKDGGLALAFLEFCGSAAFGSEHLKKISRYSAREEVLETAVSVFKAPKENTDSVMEEFFLAVRQISCEVEEEFEIEGMLFNFMKACLLVAEKCPEALYSFIYYFCNSSWEGVEEAVVYMGLFAGDGGIQAFSSLRKNTERMAELAEECLGVAKAILACAKEGRDGAFDAVQCFSDAAGVLSTRWPSALVPFAHYFQTLLIDKKPEKLHKLAESFTSEDNLKALNCLGNNPQVKAALMKACYMDAVGTKAN